MSDDKLPKDVEEVVETSQLKIIASLLLTGSGITTIAKELNISKYRVSKLMKSPDFKEYLAETTDQMVTVAANTWRGMMQELVPLAHKALKKALERGDLKGVEVVIKSLGIDKQQPQQQSGTLQVILPDFNQPKEVKAHIVEDK